MIEMVGQRPKVEPERELLTTLKRGPGCEVRVSLDDLEGNQFVNIRQWEGGYPTRKGVTVRLHELGTVIDALTAARDTALDRAARREPPRPTRFPERAERQPPRKAPGFGEFNN